MAQIMAVPQVERNKRRKSDQFMNELMDELLVEIFIRLPDSRSAIRCSSVCKRWLSLISPESNPQFVADFVHRHRDSPLPYAFRIELLYQGPVEYTQVCCPRSRNQLDADEDFLAFVGETQQLTVMASCRDLVVATNLLTSYPRPSYLVCNPFTKQWTRLPELLPTTAIFPDDLGLACDPDRRVYKVVCFTCGGPDGGFDVQIFSSDTWEWEYSTVLSSPLDADNISLNPCTSTVTARADGTLIWLDHWAHWEPHRPRRLVLFNPFDGGEARRCSFINLPGWFRRVPVWSSDSNLCVRESGGRLRVASLSGEGPGPRSLRVYELGDDSLTWRLVRRERLRVYSPAAVHVLGMHPDDEDVLFLLFGRSVLRYKFGKTKNKSRTVVKFPKETKPFLEDISVFRLEFPTWPTRP